MQVIEAKHLVKHFRALHSEKKSPFHRVKGFFFPKYQMIKAVDDISLSIERGERVAFIGPNGAGKSTTIKLLTGIMHPTSGVVKVLNTIPTKNRKALSLEISALFGHCSKLWVHLPVQESYSLLASIYNIPGPEYRARLKELIREFDIEPLLRRVVRQLSLGERMRCEIVASLLHRPQIIFLDEPTIGLDVSAKAIIRNLLCKFSKQSGTTLLLTSHDTDDIETVCDRAIMINKGKLILDDKIDHMKTHYVRKKIIHVVCAEESLVWEQEGVEILEKKPHKFKLSFDPSKCPTDKMISDLLNRYSVKDIAVENPSLESIIKAIYEK